jgi:hypothetical protein
MGASLSAVYEKSPLWYRAQSGKEERAAKGEGCGVAGHTEVFASREKFHALAK